MSRRSKDKKRSNAPGSKQIKPTSGGVSHTVLQQYIHQGPLPPPEQLLKYEEACVGAAERIITMAEIQARHRQELEKITIKRQTRNSTLGLLFGFVIGMTAIISGAWVSMAGYSWEGFATSFAGLGSLVGVFVYGKKANQEELREKKQLMDDNKE